MKQKLMVVMLAAALALVIGACGQGEEATATPEAASTVLAFAQTPETPEAGATTEGAGTPEAGAAAGAEVVGPPDVERGPVSATAPLERNGMYEAPPEMTIDPAVATVEASH